MEENVESLPKKIEQVDQNFLQNLSNFLGQVSLQRRAKIKKEEEERGIIPQPLLFDEGRLLIRGALEQFRRRRFLEQSGAQSTIRQSLRLLVGLLVDNNLLKKSLKKK